MKFTYVIIINNQKSSYPSLLSFYRRLKGYSPSSRAAFGHQSGSKGYLAVTFQIIILIRNRALNLLTSFLYS